MECGSGAGINVNRYAKKEKKRQKKKEEEGLMETAAAVEKQKTVFPQQLAKRLPAFRTVPTGPAASSTIRQGKIQTRQQIGNE